MLPAKRTKIGMSHTYFKGTAIRSKPRKERASSPPMIRKNFSDVSTWRAFLSGLKITFLFALNKSLSNKGTFCLPG